MSETFPGYGPMHGDAVLVFTDASTMPITGEITSQGILRDGRGYVELTLPDADPQQRRALESTERYKYNLYNGDTLLYASPSLTVREIRREGKDGALVVTGSP